VSRQEILAIVRALRADPGAQFTTEQAARAIGVRPAEFVRQFRQLTGVSPLRFRSALRIDRAKRLLLQNDLPVTDVALQCGYDSLGTFIRMFTRRVGLPPSAFRAMAREPARDPLDFFGLPTSRNETGVHGFVPDPAPEAPMLVALGLFSKGVPAGPPLSGQVLINGGRFSLGDKTSHGWRYLLGFAIPWDASLWSPPEARTFVLSRALRRCAGDPIVTPHLKWRRLTETDPPILLALPALFVRSDGIRDKQKVERQWHDITR
jgi:AraC-like DNA-binding protein